MKQDILINCWKCFLFANTACVFIIPNQVLYRGA